MRQALSVMEWLAALVWIHIVGTIFAFVAAIARLTSRVSKSRFGQHVRLAVRTLLYLAGGICAIVLAFQVHGTGSVIFVGIAFAIFGFGYQVIFRASALKLLPTTLTIAVASTEGVYLLAQSSWVMTANGLISMLVACIGFVVLAVAKVLSYESTRDPDVELASHS